MHSSSTRCFKYVYHGCRESSQHCVQALLHHTRKPSDPGSYFWKENQITWKFYTKVIIYSICVISYYLKACVQCCEMVTRNCSCLCRVIYLVEILAVFKLFSCGNISFKCEDIFLFILIIIFTEMFMHKHTTENVFLPPDVIHDSQASQSWEVPQLRTYYSNGCL